MSASIKVWKAAVPRRWMHKELIMWKIFKDVEETHKLIHSKHQLLVKTIERQRPHWFSLTDRIHPSVFENFPLPAPPHPKKNHHHQQKWKSRRITTYLNNNNNKIYLGEGKSFSGLCKEIIFYRKYSKFSMMRIIFGLVISWKIKWYMTTLSEKHKFKCL